MTPARLAGVGVLTGWGEGVAALPADARRAAAGRDVIIVSSAPEEVVRPLGEFLGVDDVIATGGTVHGACALLARVDVRIAGVATILLKGPAPSVPRLIALARPLL